MVVKILLAKLVAKIFFVCFVSAASMHELVKKASNINLARISGDTRSFALFISVADDFWKRGISAMSN